MFKLYNQDCLEVMAALPDKSINFICCDLPYGTTDFEWDTIIPFDKLWEQYERLITDNGTIALFASGKFVPKVFASNPDLYRYYWVWVKNTCMFYIHAHNRPMTKNELIIIFSKGVPNHETVAKVRQIYNPQGVHPVKHRHVDKPRTFEEGRFVRKNSPSIRNTYLQQNEGYPSDVLFFKNASKEFHPTEKPVDLLMYLIKTYTDDGMTVLDNCMGGGSCGEAAVRCNRNFIGIEKDNKYFNVAENRLNNLKWQGGLLDEI